MINLKLDPTHETTLGLMNLFSLVDKNKEFFSIIDPSEKADNAVTYNYLKLVNKHKEYDGDKNELIDGGRSYNMIDNSYSEENLNDITIYI